MEDSHHPIATLLSERDGDTSGVNHGIILLIMANGVEWERGTLGGGRRTM